MAEAKKQIGSKAWALDVARNSPVGDFKAGEYKCNLFIAEMMIAAGLEIPMINYQAEGMWEKIRIKIGGKCPAYNRPPCAADWYNAKDRKDLKFVRFVGEGVAGMNACWPGDIVSNGIHCGLVSSPQCTISASKTEVIENNFGWRPEFLTGDHIIRVYRYHP
jgi:hypothetical protein